MIIKRIEIPDFLTEIQLTKTRRAKKNAEGKITNKAWLSKPRLKKINGQDLWIGINPNLRSKMARELKLYLYDKIKTIGQLEKFPIGVDIEFHLPMSKNEATIGDIDNLQIWYRKCLHDALAGNVEYHPYTILKKDSKGELKQIKSYVANHLDYPPLIPDDDFRYIQEANTKFVEIDNYENRKLVIIIRTIND